MHSLPACLCGLLLGWAFKARSAQSAWADSAPCVWCHASFLVCCVQVNISALLLRLDHLAAKKLITVEQATMLRCEG